MDTSVFDQGDFDPIAYINQKFPDENSLVGLDEEISGLKQELGILDEEILESIHEHSILNQQLQQEIERAQTTTKDIIREVISIRNKAEKSEALVNEMSKDIKSLDRAKENLTYSINSLKNFGLIITTIEQLRGSCEQRRYKDVANSISALNEFIQKFKKYETISQVQEQIREKDRLQRELILQLEEDFTSFGKNTNIMNIEQMHEACLLIEILGTKVKDQIGKIVIDNLISEYKGVFLNPENATIDNTERRYAWLHRNLNEFNVKYKAVFPHYWGIQCYLVNEFCSVTCVQLTSLLEKKANQTDVTTLLKALQATLKFEQRINDDMHKEYEMYLKSNPIALENLMEHQKKFAISALPRFKGSISDCFEPYMTAYVEREEQELRENILKSLQTDEADISSELKIYNSSIFLFNYIKTTLKRASQYSRSQMMLNIYNVFRKVIRIYRDELQLRLQREEKLIRGKDEILYERNVCLIINTAEYCKDTLSGLSDSIQMCLDSPYNEDVDFGQEEDTFNSLINLCNESLLNNIDNKLENSFSFIYKNNWDKEQLTYDASPYVKETSINIGNHLKNIKSLLSEVYLNFFLNKLGSLINNRFINSLLKNKKIPNWAFHQLRIDFEELRTHIINLLKAEPDKVNTNTITYIDNITIRSQSLFRMLNLTNQQIISDFKTLYKGGISPLDLEKLLQLKGIKKTDIPNFNNIVNQQQS